MLAVEKGPIGDIHWFTHRKAASQQPLLFVVHNTFRPSVLFTAYSDLSDFRDNDPFVTLKAYRVDGASHCFYGNSCFHESSA